MLLGKRFEAFVEESPVSVMVQGTLERSFAAEDLDEVFEDTAVVQYTKELAFSQCVQMMSDVVFGISPSVGAWYQDHQDDIPVTRQAVYDKLRHVEPNVSAEVVRYSARQLQPVLRRISRSVGRPLLPGYRTLVVDGNHLAGTEHRIFELRRTRAAALPGQALALYDPRYDLIVDSVPCEDAHAQERSLLGEVLGRIMPRDAIVADRNFCTTGFLFGIHRRRAFFVIRQHKSTLTWKLVGRRRRAGTDEKGRAIYEQEVCLTDAETGETLTARRITIQLDKPTSSGDMEIHILTNIPVKDADALTIATVYAERWTIETAFQHVTEDLRCEVDTLGYPKAALFGFCLALMAYNLVSLVKGVIRSVWGSEFVEDELSIYYLTLEVSQVTPGMCIAIPDQHWNVFRTVSDKHFVDKLIYLARRMTIRKYTKHKRGPKKKPPKKASGKRIKHVSTARILAMRR